MPRPNCTVEETPHEADEGHTSCGPYTELGEALSTRAAPLNLHTPQFVHSGRMLKQAGT